MGQDGTGEPWDFEDGWAYRRNNTGPSKVFILSDWLFNGPDALDGETTNATAASPMPIGTFVIIPEPGTVGLVGIALIALLARRRDPA